MRGYRQVALTQATERGFLKGVAAAAGVLEALGRVELTGYAAAEVVRRGCVERYRAGPI